MERSEREAGRIDGPRGPMTRRVYNLGIGLHFQPIGFMVFTQDLVENRPFFLQNTLLRETVTIQNFVQLMLVT